MRALESAVNLFRGGLYDEALLVLESNMTAEPDCGRLWELRGLVLRAQGNISLACDSLEHATLLRPLSHSGQVTLADCLTRLGRPQVALCIAEHVMTLKSVDCSLLVYLAQVCDSAQRPDLSVKLCERVNERLPQFHPAHYDRGFYLGRLGRPLEEIEAAARQAIAIAPDVANYRVGLASLLWQRGDFDGACCEAAQLSPSQLQQLTCECCLRRLIKIFWSANAFGRCQACVERLEELAGDSHSADPGCCL
ncbi:tetratricopeptide repeat protein [Anatilimnocola floriformis]|uniref:tetratricopeptide repeat protein n=1 Tax=Anatilimnocola floriformis TaxID=2948575 RepID=UPI0020C1BB0C|nr:tetratricopeptide repeat protein [Anatilimnocola floriformis]